MYKKCDKYRSQVPKGHSDIFRLFILSNQQSKTQRYLINNVIKQRKVGNPHIWEAGIRCLSFLAKHGTKDSNVGLSVGLSTTLVQTKISQQLFAALPWNFKFLNPNYFGDPLTFYPAPPAGQSFYLSSEISQHVQIQRYSLYEKQQFILYKP